MGKDRALRYLQKLPLFAGLPDDVLVGLAEKTRPVSLEANQVLFNRGDDGDAVYIIEFGHVKVTVDGLTAADEVMLNQLGPGEIIGEVALLDGDVRTANVIAITPTTLYELKRDDFFSVVRRNPSVALDLMRNLATRLRFTNVYLERAIEIAQQIARGDYHIALAQIRTTQNTIIDTTEPDESRADALLAAFLEMVVQVKEREDRLKEELQSLTINIDPERKARDVEALTESTFFGNLKAAVQTRRARRTGDTNPPASKTDPPNPDPAE